MIKDSDPIKINLHLILVMVIVSWIMLIPIASNGQVPKQALESNSISDMMDLKERLVRLEDRQDLLVDAAARDLGRFYFIFSAVSAFFALFVVFLALRNFFESQRRNRIEDQHMVQLQGMMGSFRDNVNTINALINSLRQTFDFQADISRSIQAIDERIQDLDNFRKQEEINFRSQVDSLNRRCTEIFKQCFLHRRDRESFKQEENRIALQSVTDHFDTLERTGDIEGLASPIAFYLRGLSRFNSMQYDEAIKDYYLAREHSRRQLNSPLAQFGSWDADEIQRNLRVAIDETYYHLGIIFYNVGDWDKAKEEFVASYESYTLDFRSRAYIPELMFFDNRSDPRKTEAEYAAVESQLSNVTSEDRNKMDPSWVASYSSLKLRQGNFYIKKLFPPRERAAIWGDFEDSKKAIECFWKAKEHEPESAVVNFSLAQAMEYDGKSALWKDFIPDELFRDAFYKFRNSAIMKTEPILLTMLYYCVAITCFHGKIQGDNASTYLGLARQHLQRVPSNIRVFSPINKINMDHGRLLLEMDQLEKWWQGR